MWTLFQIALRNVLRNRRRTLITLAALLLGVSVMVSIQGIVNGLQRAMITSVVDSGVGALQIHRAGYMKNVLASPLDLDLPADEAFLDKVRAVPGVKAAAPRILFAGNVSVGDTTLFAIATALDPVLEPLVSPHRSGTFTEGSRFEPGDGVLLSSELARALETERGAEGVLLAPDQNGALNGALVRYAGEVGQSMPGERKFALVPLAVAQELLRMEGRATEIGVAIDDPEEAELVAGRLRAALGDEYEVHTWSEVAVFVTAILARQNFILRFIGVVFLLLMLLGVANTTLMSVMERTREIGTMMAVGVRRSSLGLLFLFEALLIGAAGGVVGGVAGLLITAFLSTRGLEFSTPGSTVPFLVQPWVSFGFLAEVVVIAAVGSVAFALYPARRAARLRPVEALAGS